MNHITVELLDKAWDELNEDAELLHMTRTDTLNRAIQVQHLVVWELAGGATLRIERVLPPEPAPLWKRWLRRLLGYQRIEYATFDTESILGVEPLVDPE